MGAKSRQIRAKNKQKQVVKKNLWKFGFPFALSILTAIFFGAIVYDWQPQEKFKPRALQTSYKFPYSAEEVETFKSNVGGIGWSELEANAIAQSYCLAFEILDHSNLEIKDSIKELLKSYKVIMAPKAEILATPDGVMSLNENKKEIIVLRRSALKSVWYSAHAFIHEAIHDHYNDQVQIQKLIDEQKIQRSEFWDFRDSMEVRTHKILDELFLDIESVCESRKSIAENSIDVWKLEIEASKLKNLKGLQGYETSIAASNFFKTYVEICDVGVKRESAADYKDVCGTLLANLNKLKDLPFFDGRYWTEEQTIIAFNVLKDIQKLTPDYSLWLEPELSTKFKAHLDRFTEEVVRRRELLSTSDNIINAFDLKFKF